MIVIDTCILELQVSIQHMWSVPGALPTKEYWENQEADVQTR